MICESCPLSTDEPCGLWDEYGIEDKDGYCRCKVPWNKIHKLDMEYADYLGNMGTDMGVSMECERLGIPEEEVIETAKHMVGLDYKKPYHRHGNAYYKPYRNYFDAPEGGDRCLEVLPSYLISKRETESAIGGKGVWYKLTHEGLEWLGRRLNITIYDERK